MKSLLVKIALLIVIVVLAYMVYNSIMQPVHFNKEKSTREVEVVQRLKDIRSLQIFYRQANGKYSDNFDSLSAFLRNGEIPVVKLVADPNDTTFTKTIADTLGYIAVIDSLFGKRKNFNANDLRYIPFSNKVSFELAAGEMDRGGVRVGIFEAKAPFKVYLQGLDEQRVINLIASREQLEKYPGLKVGSMVEPSTDGNWE
jgi:hypothetical protein